jgi:hypothetical protein
MLHGCDHVATGYQYENGETQFERGTNTRKYFWPGAEKTICTLQISSYMLEFCKSSLIVLSIG